MNSKLFIFSFIALEIAIFISSYHALTLLLAPLGPNWSAWSLILPLLILGIDWLSLLNYSDYITRKDASPHNYLIAGAWIITALITGWLFWVSLSVNLLPFLAWASYYLSLAIALIITTLRGLLAFCSFPLEKIGKDDGDWLD